MKQYTPKITRLRLDVFPGRHGVTYALTGRTTSGDRFDSKTLVRGTLPYPADVADLDAYDLLRAALDHATRPG